jgi:hypothetical protein
LARQFRLYGKKRGARRTGSRRLGMLGEAALYLLLFGVGASVLTLMLKGFIVPEWRANRYFQKTLCTVLKTRLASRQAEGGTQFRPEVLIRYNAGGTTLETAAWDIHQKYSEGRADQEELLARFRVGARYPCWYDLTDPRTVVVVRGYNWSMWVLLILPLSFVIIGTAGVLHAMLQSSTSAERRAALVRRAAKLDLFEDAPERDSNYPNVPRIEVVTDSPGTQLAYRLPVEMATGWTLFGMATLCLFWNGVVIWAGIGVIRDHLHGQHDILATVVLVGFFLGGIALVVQFLHRVLVTTGMGTTRLEVSGHPFFPGMTYQAFLSQTGRLEVNAIELLLVCDEEAVYRQGTDTRVATQRVYRQSFYRRESIVIRPGRPFEDTAEVRVPDDAMHSFHAAHNEVKWKIVIEADMARWPEYRRSFPVVVYPAPERSAPR